MLSFLMNPLIFFFQPYQCLHFFHRGMNGIEILSVYLVIVINSKIGIKVIDLIQNILMKLVTLLLILATLHLIHSSTPSHLTSLEDSFHMMSKNSHQRKKDSGWVIFVIGPIAFFSTLVCIWYNEKKAAIDMRRLHLAQEICVDVNVMSEASARSKENKLVYANGTSKTNVIIGDRLSNVNGPNLIKISRIVEVLEWRRHQSKSGKNRYHYDELEWVTSHSQIEGGKTNNPSNWVVNGEVLYNQQVFLGGYNIGKEVADKCNKTIPFTPTIELAHTILANTRRNDRAPSIEGEYIYFNPGFQGLEGPQVGGHGEGTMRLKYVLCPTGPLSLIGRSAGPTFANFDIAQYEGTTQQTNNVDGCCCCISECYAKLLEPVSKFLEVYEENISRDEILDRAVKDSECFTWGIRILAFICMVISIFLIFLPLVVLLNYIPLIGGLVSGIVGFSIFLAAILISIPIYILMISIAWLYFHPKVGLILLAIGGVILTVFLILGRNSGADEGAAEAQAHFLALRQLVT